MKITKIEKKKRLYLLEFDDHDKLYVTEDTIVRFMLSKGMNISPKELQEIREFAQFSYGKNLALYHLSFKQRTTKEVEYYLQKYDIDSQIIPSILNQLKEDKWLDDQHYAEQFIQQNLSSGDKGPYVLEQKLKQKGISKHTIQTALEEEDFSPLAEKVAEKLLRTYQAKLSKKALENKIIQTLSNKGFSYSQAKAAFQNLSVEKDQELEEELIYAEIEKQLRKFSRKYQGYELKQRLMQSLARKGFDFSDISSALREYF